MSGFNAKLELPRYIAKEEILQKQVFDSEIRRIGPVKDWTYSSDGKIKMIVKIDGDPTMAPVLIPFYEIEKVGEHILLKVKRSELQTEFGVSLNKEQSEEEQKEKKPK